MISEQQIGLVRDSFAEVLPFAIQSATFFYDRLFVLAPDTRELFRGDMAAQGRKLFQTLALIVDALHQINDVLPVARALAVRHVSYGVQEAHYAAVGVALIDTLRHRLGTAFNEDIEAAWALAYEILSLHMILAARDADQRDVAA